jgi:NDP-mannose synthase
MGVYIAEPTVPDYVDPGKYLDVPDLVLRLLRNHEQVGAFLYEGYWLDIGRHEDYEKAILEYDQLKNQLFPGARNGPALIPPATIG